MHLFNRGVEKRQIFNNYKDYLRFFHALCFYVSGYQDLSTYLDNLKRGSDNFAYATLEVVFEKKPLQKSKPLAKILALCLMPNHFHLLLQQVREQGIALFIQRFSNSYTKYFNTKRERVGLLFQGKYKSVLIETDEQLLHLSRYIHLNPSELAPPVKSQNQQEETIQFVRNYPWSSYADYVGQRKDGLNKLIDKSIILNFFQQSKWPKVKRTLGSEDLSYKAFVETYLQIPAVGVENLILE